MEPKRNLKISLPVVVVVSLVVGLIVGLTFYGLSLWHSKSSLTEQDQNAALQHSPEKVSIENLEPNKQQDANRFAKNSAADPKAEKYQQYQDQLELQSNIQTFAKTINQQDLAENEQQYAELLPKILAAQQKRFISRAESFYLQASLLSQIYQDTDELKNRLAELSKNYPQQPATKDHLDDHYYQYKAEEKRILQEVMAMDAYPNGMSREDYLRQQLLAARKKIYQ